MAYVPFNDQNKPRARNLRAGLDQLRDGLYRLRREMQNMAQMTDDEVQVQYDVQASAGTGNATALQNAATLKSEVTADISKLLTDASQTNVNAALTQLLAMTG